jgi:magnesium transporter
MPESIPNIQLAIQQLSQDLQQERLDHVIEFLDKRYPAEISLLLDSLPYTTREKLWLLVDEKMQGDILLHVKEEVRTQLIKCTPANTLLKAIEKLDTDDLADILRDLPDTVIAQLLRSMDKQNRKYLTDILSYPEDSAGGLMNIDPLLVRPELSLEVVLRYLRYHGHIPKGTDALVVTDRKRTYLGLLPIQSLLTCDPKKLVKEVMSHEDEAIPVNFSSTEVANIFEKRDLISAPVVDPDNKVVGRITIDDVVDVIRDDAEHSLMSMAGLDEEEDTFAPVISSARHRNVWLGINLLTALLASWVIGHFDATIEKLVALAVLMPIVASMGGIAGSQTLTLVIRGMALGQIGTANIRWLVNREVFVGMLNGLIWALVVSLITLIWFQDTKLAMIIGLALMINLLVAAFAGAVIPMVLARLSIDPALAGSVILTTITDVIGFLSFLGLATLVLL